ncbi:hypothetical protein SAMN06264867_10761 [Halorubrum cibi]|uniref:Uncharacterized protein n=1 Tax=Halorubrum cibi TaxID=413815 RepID=A0A521DJE1_9EURY|nr:hypothetical protein SAMN06264867_10761 [Halorubrum cibi]
MIYSSVGCKFDLAAGSDDTISELRVATGDQSMIEETDVLEHISADGDTASTTEIAFLCIHFDRKTGMCVVSCDERVSTLRNIHFYVIREILRAMYLTNNGFEPIGVCRDVGVNEDENVSSCPRYSSIPGRIRTLYVVFNGDEDATVFIRVFMGHVTGIIRGVVVDDDDLYTL